MADNADILVTAGPTWIPLDSVRVVTNIFSGRTGYSIAESLARRGYRTTLLLGPAAFTPAARKNLTIHTFTYFEDMRRLVKRQLENKTYSMIVHTAAVSDYQPLRVHKGKIASKQERLVIEMKPTPKIIRDMRRLAPEATIIQFKLETGLSRRELIERAYTSLTHNRSDWVVANDLKDMRGGEYRGILIDRDRNTTPVASRRELIERLAVIAKTVV